MVFVKRRKVTDEGDVPVSVLVGKRQKKGDVGIEIELESSVPNSFPKTGKIADYWLYEKDGSLRGADNAEYVLEKPLDFDDVDKAVDGLWEALKKVKFEDSNRTSVHVHTNVGSFYMNRLCSFVALWYTFEDVLTHWCGDYRVGNLFCLRAKDAEGPVRKFINFVEKNGDAGLSESLHYSALNFHALVKFGSLEFRTLRGTSDPEVIKTWVKIIRKLYDKSAEFQDPRTLIETFSLDGALPFFYNTFGSLAATIKNEIDLTEDQFRDSLYEGMRIAQEVCYARDWSSFDPKKVEIDPFMRKNGKAEWGPIPSYDEDDELEIIPAPAPRPRTRPATLLQPGESLAAYTARLAARNNNPFAE